MKLVRLTTAYPEYLRAFYRANSRLRGGSFEEQKRQLDRDAFGWADFWTAALAPLGYEVLEIVANAAPMQKAWARENGVAPGTDWLHGIARAQVEKFAPEVLFLDDFSTFSAGWIRNLRVACPSIRLVLGWCGAPYDDGEVFHAYDVVLSCIPELVEEFRAAGHVAYHLNHAFDPRILERVPTAEKDVEVSFIGQLSPSRQAHNERIAILAELARRLDIRIHSPQAVGWFDLPNGLLAQFAKSLIKKPWYYLARGLKAAGAPVERLGSFGRPLGWRAAPPLVSLRSPIEGMRGPLFGLEMYRLLARSRVTLNSHTDLSPRSASNMRLFEATGMGSCLVTDWKSNLADLFADGIEVVAYRSVEECVEKVQWLREHPREAEAIASSGQKRVLAEHTFAHRAPLLDGIVRKHL